MLMFNTNYDKYYNKSGKWEVNSVTRVVRRVDLHILGLQIWNAG